MSRNKHARVWGIVVVVGGNDVGGGGCGGEQSVVRKRMEEREGFEVSKMPAQKGWGGVGTSWIDPFFYSRCAR